MQLGQPIKERERQGRDWRARCHSLLRRAGFLSSRCRGKTGPVFIIGPLSIVAVVARARLHTIASGIELLSI